jgi:hypothetical protein
MSNNSGFRAFNENEIIFCNNNNMQFIAEPSKNKKSLIIDRKKIKFSIIIDENIKQNKNIIKKPLIKELGLIEKILINNEVKNSIIYIQEYFRNKKKSNNKKYNSPIRTIIKSQIIITKIYKDNSLNNAKITKIQNKIKKFLNSNQKICCKPKNLNLYITKKYIGQSQLKDFEKANNSKTLNIITQKGRFINNLICNIDEIFYEREVDNKKSNDITTINSNRKMSEEKNGTYEKNGKENKNITSIKIINQKIYKNSIDYNCDNKRNIKYNLNSNINIESLPSFKSWKTNSDNNEIFINDNNLDNKKIGISIQTLESKESKNNYNKYNIHSKKRLTTEKGKFKIESRECEC